MSSQHDTRAEDLSRRPRSSPVRARLRRVLWVLGVGGLLLAAQPPLAHALLQDMPDFYLTPPGEEVPVDVLAEKIIYDEKSKTGTAVGRVRIIWGPYVMVADKVVYHLDTERFEAYGDAHIREPNGNILVADYASIDKFLREGFARHLRLMMTNGASLRSRYAIRKEGNITIYTDNAYTACETCLLPNGEPVWEIRSKRAVHDQRKGRIYHDDVTFRFLGVPVLWSPYFSHPDPNHPRSSGFLVPGFGWTEKLGVRVTLPYFFNLGPNYDLTYIPSIYSKQGVFSRFKWRHNIGPGTYIIDGGGIYQLQPDLLPTDERNRLRWYISTEATFDINKAWQWGFKGAWQSDHDVMRRYTPFSGSNIYSHVWLQGLDGRNFLRAETGQYHYLYDGRDHALTPTIMPWVYHEYTFRPAILGGALSLNSSLLSTRREKSGRPKPGIVVPGRNVRLASELDWRREWITGAGVQVQPFAQLRGEVRVAHELPDVGAPGTTFRKKAKARLFPRAGVDLRWPFMAGLENGYHVISPVAQLIIGGNEYDRRESANEDAIAPRFSASHLFLHDRFMGFDRFEGGARANYGLAYGLYLNDASFLRLTLGQSTHFLGKNSFEGTSIGLQKTYSDLVTGVAMSWQDMMLLSARARFDNKTFELQDLASELDLRFQNLTINLKYAYTNPLPEYGVNNTENRYSAYASWNISDHWRIFGGLNYMLRQDWHVSRQVGVEYDCDCLTASLTLSDNISNDIEPLEDFTIELKVKLYTLGEDKITYKSKENF